jgi:hypothetical protein
MIGLVLCAFVKIVEIAKKVYWNNVFDDSEVNSVKHTRKRVKRRRKRKRKGIKKSNYTIIQRYICLCISIKMPKHKALNYFD